MCMLVILMKGQLLQPSAVCQSCPMASQSGQPRWHQGRLRCGRLIESPVGDGADENAVADNASSCKDAVIAENKCPAQYECAMGFRVAELRDTLS